MADLTALVRSAAVEPGPGGVRVNAVAPGVVRTPRAAAPPGTGGGEAPRRTPRRAGAGARGRRWVGLNFPYPTIGGDQ
ncbi:SDR family oxidoreductase [Streptomyces xanthophaeus]|nr:SDR family oxidoreductase [Streptomyces xanthophaeus]